MYLEYGLASKNSMLNEHSEEFCIFEAGLPYDKDISESQRYIEANMNISKAIVIRLFFQVQHILLNVSSLI